MFDAPRHIQEDPSKVRNHKTCTILWSVQYRFLISWRPGYRSKNELIDILVSGKLKNVLLFLAKELRIALWTLPSEQPSWIHGWDCSAFAKSPLTRERLNNGYVTASSKHIKDCFTVALWGYIFSIRAVVKETILAPKEAWIRYNFDRIVTKDHTESQ